MAQFYSDDEEHILPDLGHEDEPKITNVCTYPSFTVAVTCVGVAMGYCLVSNF